MAVTFLLWPSAVVVKPPWPIGVIVTGVLQQPPGRQEHLRHH
jgi:hypothetical protein